MTSSEVKSSSNATYAVPKKMGNETVNRKTSFKCASPSKAASQKVSRKVVLPISSVKALTFKFNELSQISDEQKHRISQTAVKSILTANGKSSTIKVVICRKPSASKYRRSDDGLIRKKNNLRRLQTSNPSGLEESKNSSRNVHKKVSEFEEKEKAEVDTKNGLNLNKARTKKMQVPKVLVDIDLSGENCLVSHKNPQNESESTESKIEREENSLSVKTAINLFEQNSKISTSPDKNLNGREKISTLKRSSDTLNSNNDTNKGEKTEIVPEIKTKPIAAIKPILKKTEDKSTRRTKLLPKDSLNRKKYVLMKRELTKSNEAIDNAEKDSQSNSEKENWDEEKKDVEEDSERFQVSESAKESEGKLKNESSLHKQLRQSSFSVLINEIPLQEEESSIIKVDPVPETPIQNPNTSLKPNTSFLWSKKEELYAEKRAVNRIDLPLPIPPKDYIPNIIDNENETVYDDVLVKSEDSEREEFEKMSDSDAEETYDDVGTENNFFEKEVREKNLFNKMSGADAEALYDHPENCMYLYDDGEGEKYQYISEVSESIYEVSKETELEVYQYIQNDDDGANIYEDIQSIKCHLTKCDRVKDTYEDIACQVDSGADNGLVSNCYESVYNGIYSSDNGTQGYVKSDVSDTSNNSGRSSYEKNNSLYGIPAGNPIGSDHLLSELQLNNFNDKFKIVFYKKPTKSTAANSHCA